MNLPGRAPTDYILVGITWLLVAGLPFEALEPVFDLAGLSITNLEVLVALTFIPLLIGISQPSTKRRLMSFWRSYRDLLLPALVSLAVAALSAMVAPAYREEALKSFGRQALGVYVFLLLLSVGRRHGYRGIILALLIGATLSGLLGVAEFVDLAFLNPLIDKFKSNPTFVGGQLRVSASFQYASIASMYYEMTVPLALVLAARSSRRAARLGALALGIILIMLVVLTLTRAGYIALSVALIGLWFACGQGTRLTPLRKKILIGLASLFLAIGWLAWQNNAFRARLTTENDLSWYGAVYDLPNKVDINMGEPSAFTVAVHNTGLFTWPESGRVPVHLSYRWLSSDGRRAFDLPAGQVPLPHPIRPGESVTLTANLDPQLPPGQYLLSWGMVQEGVLPFSSRGVAEGLTAVNILPGEGPTPFLPDSRSRHPGEISASPPIITTRGELWRTAVLMWRDRPLLGHGPNNFRHLYGHYLGLHEWDQRIHANNLYLEILADTGLMGVFSFAWFVVAVARRLRPSVLARNRPGLRLWSVGLGAAFLALLTHGFLDYFFEFHAISLLFWVLAALIGVLTRNNVYDRSVPNSINPGPSLSQR